MDREQVCNIFGSVDRQLAYMFEENASGLCIIGVGSGSVVFGYRSVFSISVTA